jgi:hypothetical protein
MTAVSDMKIHVRLRYVLKFGAKVSGVRFQASAPLFIIPDT